MREQIVVGRRSFLSAVALAAGACVGATPAWAASEATQASSSDLVAIGRDSLTFDAPLMSAQSDGVSNSQLSTRVTTREYSGQTRYDTATSIAKAAFPSGSASAILIGGEEAWPDALSAACLAAYKGPILLTNKSSLPSDTSTALKELGVNSVIIVGGTASVGPGVEVALAKAGISVEKRLGGADRQEAQLSVFNYGLERGYWEKDLIILAAGMKFPDALAASPISYALRAPIFITGSGNVLSSAQKDAWRAAAKQGYGKRVAIVGGPASVDASARSFADEMRALANGSGKAEWVYDNDRYSTSVAIAEWAVNNWGFTWNNVAFASGLKPWDALTGSVLQGKDKSVLLLADSMYSASISKVGAKKSLITSLRIFGGKASVVPSVRMKLADSLGFPVAALPNFKLYLDAGHGPNDNGSGDYDPGAGGSGYWEYDLTKELANKIAPLLRARGVNVFVNDDGGPYKLRHAEAVAQGCDAILSLHFNAGGGSGSESLIHEYNANEYSSTWQGKIHPKLISGLGLRDRGQKTQEVAILGGQLPAVLLEVCFIDNSNDMSTYQSRKNTVASQIAAGIMS